MINMMRWVMERSGLTMWPILSLLIFTISSAIMIAWMFRRGSKEFYAQVAQLALGDNLGDKDDTYQTSQYK
jgi:cbb3-type cytochrome oxidase subunit 3